MGFAMQDGTCVDVNTLAFGLGIDVEQGTVASCKTKNCMLCRNDHRYCTACDISKGYELVNDKCIIKSETKFLEIVKAISYAEIGQLSLRFNSLVEVEAKMFQHVAINLTSEAGVLITNDTSMFSLIPKPDGFDIEILIPENMMNLTMGLTLKNYSDRRLFVVSHYQPDLAYSEYPITVRDLDFFNKKSNGKYLRAMKVFNLTMSSISSSPVGAITSSHVQSFCSYHARQTLL